MGKMIVCKKCGACCKMTGHGKDDKYFDVELYSDEAIKLKKLYERRIGGPWRLQSLWMKRKPNGECIALENNRCIVYDKRPVGCRHFEPSSRRCVGVKYIKPRKE